jgi:transcriptional regulator with XRE-family HTH domain
MKLQQRIIIARQQKGLTQEELAELAGLSIRTVQRIESGDSIPRSFTLKAIADALGQSFEQLATDVTTKATPPASDVRHSLQLINLSCFSFIVVPWVHFLIPHYLLKKQPNPDDRAIELGRKIIRRQIYWVIALHLLLLLTLAYNFIQVYIFRQPQYVAHYLWPFFMMYFLNAAIIFMNASLIRKQF